MSWIILPVRRRDFNYFDRQRELLPDWQHLFDDTWQNLGIDEAQQRFNRELDRARDEMHRMDIQPVKLNVQKPFIKDAEGNIKFSLRFNCSQFKPEEIEVKTLDNVLKVHAKHVQEAEGQKYSAEFFREYPLPDNVEPDKLTSHLSNDGVLQIEAPVAPPPEEEPPKEILIPIQHLESKEKPKEKPKEVEQKDDDAKK